MVSCVTVQDDNSDDESDLFRPSKAGFTPIKDEPGMTQSHCSAPITVSRQQQQSHPPPIQSGPDLSGPPDLLSDVLGLPVSKRHSGFAMEMGHELARTTTQHMETMDGSQSTVPSSYSVGVGMASPGRPSIQLPPLHVETQSEFSGTSHRGVESSRTSPSTHGVQMLSSVHQLHKAKQVSGVEYIELVFTK